MSVADLALSEGGVSYSRGMEDYLRHNPEIVENGANVIGGCCATDPEYIRRMAAIVKKGVG